MYITGIFHIKISFRQFVFEGPVACCDRNAALEVWSVDALYCLSGNVLHIIYDRSLPYTFHFIIHFVLLDTTM